MRRMDYPTLDDVQPLPVAAAESSSGRQQQEQRRVFPTFLHNALFAPATQVPHHNDCPFKQYITLGARAWAKEGESKNLIERLCYETLMSFLDARFRDFEVGEQRMAVVTGTPGIGKTMFALYAARMYFQRGELVVLYYADEFWAFTKTNPQELVKNPDKSEVDPNLLLVQGTDADESFWYGYKVAGEQVQNQNKLSQWKDSGCALFIRDPGAANNLDLLESKGRELYTVSIEQESFLSMVHKSGIPAEINQRTTEVWSGEEFMHGVKLGLFDTGPPNALDLDYVMEGYRRCGGSARLVRNFAKILKEKGTPKELIQHEPARLF